MSTITLRNLRTTCLSQRNHGGKSPFNFILPSTTTISSNSHPFSSTIERPRHVSSSTTLSSPYLGTQTDKLNGPISTLPAQIDTPTRAPGQAALLYYIALGKAYVTFYKTGILNVKNNFLSSRPLLTSISKNHGSSLFQAARSGALTRAEFQLLVRNKHDVKRVPLFALVMLVCGEFTPLVVIALSNVVPWTCRIPKQITGDRRKLEARRAISFRNLTLPPPEEEEGKGVNGLVRMQLLHISWSLGLSSRVWDWLGGQLPGLPTPIIRKKVQRRVEYLEVDDRLIRTYGGVEEMSAEEVKMACVERGINVLERGEKEMRGDLMAWMESRESISIEKLLLTRPTAWQRPKQKQNQKQK